MKCPLFTIMDRRTQLGEESDYCECLKDTCSWYDLASGNCGVLELLYQFTAVGMVLGKLYDVLYSRLK